MEFNFEFDPEKSEANKVKHGIDFVEAQALWVDGNVLIFPTGFEYERRWYAVALYRDRCWTAIFTWREETIRLISVRRSRKNENELYQENHSGRI